MPNLYLLRRTPVNLLRYLPLFLSKDPTFKRTQDTLSWEHEHYRLKVLDVLAQLFVDTATWGLVEWEKFVGLSTDTYKSYEERRRDVKVRLNQNELSTVKFLESLGNQYVIDDSTRIEMHNDQYAMDVNFNRDQCWDVDALVESIEIYKPAHIGLTIYEEQKIENKVSFEAVPYLSEVIDIPIVLDSASSEIPINVSVVSTVLLEESISIGG